MPLPAAAAGRSGEAALPRSKPQSPLRITHDGEFYARLLTKESSLGNPSFRYYGAGPGAVPFVWESQPGTPKDAYSSRMLAAAAVAPAITPPPSYHLRAAAGPHGVHGHSSRRHGGRPGRGGGGRAKYCGYKLHKWIKVGFMATVFRRLGAFGRSRSSSAAASVRSSSSTRWLFSASNAGAEARDHEAEYSYEPPTPAKRVLCVGVRPGPWVVQLCGSRRDPGLPGWVYGWRP